MKGKLKGNMLVFLTHFFLLRLLCELVAGNRQMSQNQTEISRTWFPPSSTAEEQIFSLSES